MSEEPQTRDFINYEPLQIKILSPDQFEVAGKYGIILTALRENIMTVKEIHDLYLTEKDGMKTHSITQQSVYRYLDEMEKIGLITVAGFRKTEGIKASEKILGRTAKTFLVLPPTNEEQLDNEEHQDFLTHLSKLLAAAMGKKPESIDSRAFIQFYKKYAKTRASGIGSLYQRAEHDDTVVNILSNLPLQTIQELMWYIQIFLPFLQDPSLQQGLEQLFQ